MQKILTQKEILYELEKLDETYESLTVTELNENNVITLELKTGLKRYSQDATVKELKEYLRKDINKLTVKELKETLDKFDDDCVIVRNTLDGYPGFYDFYHSPIRGFRTVHDKVYEDPDDNPDGDVDDKAHFLNYYYDTNTFDTWKTKAEVLKEYEKVKDKAKKTLFFE